MIYPHINFAKYSTTTHFYQLRNVAIHHKWIVKINMITLNMGHIIFYLEKLKRG
jgi:hypothetical protein